MLHFWHFFEVVWVCLAKQYRSWETLSWTFVIRMWDSIFDVKMESNKREINASIRAFSPFRVLKVYYSGNEGNPLCSYFSTKIFPIAFCITLRPAACWTDRPKSRAWPAAGWGRKRGEQGKYVTRNHTAQVPTLTLEHGNPSSRFHFLGPSLPRACSQNTNPDRPTARKGSVGE